MPWLWRTGREEGIGDSYPSEAELNEAYQRLRYHYVLQDGLHLRKPVAPFPDIENVLYSVVMKTTNAIRQYPGQNEADGGERYNYRAELEYRLFNIEKDVKHACIEIDTMLELLPLAEDDREAHSLEYGVWLKAYGIMSGLLSTITLTGSIIRNPTILAMNMPETFYT